MNRRWTNRATGQPEEAVTFIDITAWGDLAENTAETIPKGSRVVVVGRLDQSSWETDAGEKRHRLSITAEDIAPSLKWATARIIRTTRDKAEPAATGPASSATRPAPSENSGPRPHWTEGKPHDPNEEPF